VACRRPFGEGNVKASILAGARGSILKTATGKYLANATAVFDCGWHLAGGKRMSAFGAKQPLGWEGLNGRF
jgi:hypothetical protein